MGRVQIAWCEDKHYDGATKLLNIVKGWYERGEEYRLVGRTIDRIGKMQERLGNRKGARSSYAEAGRSYLKAKSIRLALNSFEQGLNVAISEILPPSSVGYYCLKDVAVESLIPGLEAEVRYEILKEWIDQAANYFADEFQQSMPLIQDYIKTCESKLEKMRAQKIPKDSKERNEVLMHACMTLYIHCNCNELECMQQLFV